MVHKPKHKVHTFRGLLADGGQDEINLERQNVNMAYRIVKLQVFPQSPGFVSQESLIQVFREKQTSIPTASGTCEFTNVDLVMFQTIVVFDNVLFSRNIYVTHTNNEGSGECNYYLEIEEVPVSSSTLMQLKLGVARKLNLQQD
jgi:hypothetical protein